MPILSQYWFHNGFFQGPFDTPRRASGSGLSKRR